MKFKQKKLISAGLVLKGLPHECKNDWFCYQLCTLLNNGLQLAISSTCDYFLCFFVSQDYWGVYEFGRPSLLKRWMWWERMYRTLATWHCEWEFRVSAFCYGASFAVGIGLSCSAYEGNTPVSSCYAGTVTQGLVRLVGFKLRVSF